MRLDRRARHACIALVLVGIPIAGMAALRASMLLILRRGPLAHGEATRWDALMHLGHWALLAAWLVAAFTFLAWLHGLYRSALAAGRGAQLESPREMVWLWFFPLVNLWWGYQSVRNVRRAWAPQGTAPSRGVLAGWWVLYLGGITLAVIAGRLDKVMKPGPDRFHLDLEWRLASGLVLCLALGFALALILDTEQLRADSLREDSALRPASA